MNLFLMQNLAIAYLIGCPVTESLIKKSID